MNKLIYILLIIFVFISCNGNKTKNDTLKESVEKFKDSMGVLEITEYIPEKYAEVKTDSILSNGFSINIKTFTDMKKYVSTSHKMDTINYIEHYRDWVSEVKIKKNDQLIFDEKIDNEFFLKNNIIINDELPLAINTKVWIDDDAPQEKDSISLLTVFLNPADNHFIIYKIKVGNQGKYSLNKLEDY